MGMDPMSWAAIGAAAISIYGSVTANKAQAEAERKNAAVFNAQQEQNRLAWRREADIYTSESQGAIGETVSLLDKAGVDMTGSALMKVANMKEQAGREYQAIITGAQINSQIIGMRAAQAQQNASLLASDSYNGIQSLGTALNAAANVMSVQSKSTNHTGREEFTVASDNPRSYSSSWS
jgi:hypothetical protein